MISYGRQLINEGDIEAVGASLRGELLTTGPLVAEFEKELEKTVGAPTVAVSSGTAALHCAYSAIGLKPGDEVIAPPITFVATQATAANLGARIVFADVLSDTANIDPAAVAAAITQNTKAIVAVDFAGHPADLDELRLIADKHDVYLIEDAAHSIGSLYKNKSVGSIADLTTFSFFPTKNLTTGEGGAVSSKNSELLSKAAKFARQGLVRERDEFKLEFDGPWHQEVHEFGLNYRLPDILCALGISQLSRLQDFKKKRREIFNLYSEGLAGIDELQLPVEKLIVNSNWHLFPIQISKELRKDFYRYMHSQEIRVQVNYMPAYRHPVFNFPKSKWGEFPKSENFYAREVSLPMHASLSYQQIASVIFHAKSFFKK